MIRRDFTLNKREFLKRKPSILQHKLRLVMKCYTIVNFNLTDADQSFTFQKSYRVNKVRVNSDSINSGRYSYEDIPGTGDIVLTISVD